MNEIDLGRMGSQDELWLRISIVVVLLAQGFCLSLSALSSSRSRQDRSLSALLVLIALTPALVSTVFIIFTSFEFKSKEDYWAVAPWIPFIVAFRFAIESTLATVLAATVYHWIAVSRGRRLALVGGLCVGLMAWLTVNIKTKPSRRENYSSLQREDSLAAARYVRVAPEAQALVTPPILVETSREREVGKVTRYLVEVRTLDIDGPRRYVVVDATGRGDKLKLSWACVLGDKNDWMLADPCNSAKPRTDVSPAQ